MTRSLIFLIFGVITFGAEVRLRVGPETSGANSFSTLAAALVKARELRAVQADRKIILELAGGTQRITEPLVFTSADSGADAENPLVITSARGAQATISGGQLLRGWKRQAENPAIWELEIPEVKSGQRYYRQLFLNGQRRQRARTPNEGFYRIQGASPQDQPAKIKFAAEEIKSAWAEQGDVELIALLAWSELRMQIRSVDAAQRVATLSGNPRPSNKEENARYYIENALDALDAAGEWHLDRKTGILRYWALPGEDPNTDECVVPIAESLVELRGTADQPVRHVRFERITFAHTDWSLPENGYADTQAAVAIPGDIRLEFAREISFEGCTFEHLGGYAVELGQGAQKVRLAHNTIRDVGAGGIRIGETRRSMPAAEECHSHEITDNHLQALGRVYPAAVGIFILQSGTNLVAHNLIHDTYYTAISVGWTWGYEESPCRENIIEQNHLHHVGQGVLSDLGAVYTLGIQRGTVIRNNLIHDVEAFKYGGWGLYTDEGSTGIVLENNLVYRCKHAGFHQHYGRENIVRNNIFALNREHQLMRTRPEPHISFYFTNNIVYFDQGDLLGSNWSNDNYVMDRNLYFDTRHPDGQGVRFAGAAWVDWQKRHDINSIIADPKFANPQEGNFALRSDSAALKQGFVPINLRLVGPRPVP